jgi:RNA polymerase sigma factor (sigma-70 family)
MARPATDPPAGAGEFTEWVRPHLPAMARLAARLAPQADRDDVVQEALTRAWTKRRSYRPDRGSPVTWLLAITADQAAKARRRAVSLGRVASALGAVRDVVTGASEAAGGQIDLERALSRLTARQRLAVDCVYFVGLTVAETAALMRCSPGTVKSTLSDARARLRSLLAVAE